MAIKISSNTVIDNNRRGIFLKANPGTYSNSNRPSASTGDIIYNTDEQSLQVWNGSEWKNVGGLSPLTATGGNTVRTYTDAATGHQWKAHIFTSSGTFQVTALGDDIIGDHVQYFIVAGGGAGSGGGGGGGGIKTNVPGTNLSNNLAHPVSVTTYTVTVGAGGATGGPTAVPGSNSSFGPITATGGGGGGAPWSSVSGTSQAGDPGGSGGGGWGQVPGGVGGSGTSGQGNSGGRGFDYGRTPPAGGPRSQGGGGGGAAEEGLFSYRESPGGDGGDGIAVHIAGPGSYTGAGALNPRTSTYGWFAGGGGGGGGWVPGGHGGVGGGGIGRIGYPPDPTMTPTPGQANTGGGGGIDGGSGIVIIRYQIA